MVDEPGLSALVGPGLARTRGHDHVVAAPPEAARQLESLDRSAGEVVALRVELKDPERLDHFVKKARTAAATSSISDSRWPAEMPWFLRKAASWSRCGVRTT